MSNIFYEQSYNDIKALVDKLNHYRDAYYNDQKSLISDKAYDELYDILEEMEKSTGIILSNSPTQSVGYEVKSKLEKIKHSHPMLSLAKTKDVNELIKFSNNKGCILSCKMDGLTCLLSYDNGKLVQAETRGNGEEGELITHNAKFFDNIPLTIPYKNHFEIEGEAIITTYDFETINNSLPENVEKYKNPRNLASGSIRQLNNKITKNRHIKFIAWKVPNAINGCEHNESFAQRLLYAEQNFKFDVVPFVNYNSKVESIKNGLHIDDLIKNLRYKATEYGYPIDGLVLTYEDINYGNSLGMTGHHPKHSIAFKFYDDTYITEFIRFDWTMGKSGVLTPTAVFKPVEIDGTIVERASVHNVSIAGKLKLVPGDEIEVYKANMIIPQIKRNITAENECRNNYAVACPDKCPICGGKTAVILNNDAMTLECTNSDCKGKLLGKLVHFCSKSGVNIEGLSESTIEKFIELDWLNTFEDIYNLYKHSSEMMQLEGFGIKSVQKLLTSIEKSTDITLNKFICALSIPMVGRTASKTIAEYFNYDFDKFIQKCQSGFDFSILKDFGQIMCEHIDNYLDHNISKINNLATYFNFIKPLTTPSSSLLSGLTFVITGSVHKFSNRDEIKEKIESFGGKVSGSVSKNTNYLINNDIESSSGKNKKAKELNIPIITEEDLILMMNN